MDISYLKRGKGDMEKAHIHVMKWGLSQGYTIEIAYDDETDYEGTNLKDAIDTTENCGTGVIHLKSDDNYLAWFTYVLGLDRQPDELISDYGINNITQAWEKQYYKEGLEAS
jgi:hypothetical protein